MAETVPLPPLIDAQGNMNVHGRSGISLPWKMYTDIPPPQGTGTQIDISASIMWFEVNGILRQQLTTDPGDAKGLLLTIASLSAAGLLITPPNFPLYSITDLTGASPLVRAEGKIIIRGFEATPP